MSVESPAIPLAAPRRRVSRSVVVALARIVFVPLVTVAVVMFVNVLPAWEAPAPAPQATARMGLIQKDADWHVVTAAQGGASGAVWYSTGGRTFHFDLHAIGLRPSVGYFIELNVDGISYEVSSHRADAHGAVTLDTTLTAFATGACNGGDYIAPKRLEGAHRIKFLLKRDGTAVSGTRQPRGGSGPALLCHGNGDDRFDYALYEEDAAQFTGSR